VMGAIKLSTKGGQSMNQKAIYGDKDNFST
jgi:hypothetical protein